MIVQRFYDCKTIDYVEIVFNPRLFNLLIIVAKPTYEVVSHIWQLYKSRVKIDVTSLVSHVN